MRYYSSTHTQRSRITFILKTLRARKSSPNARAGNETDGFYRLEDLCEFIITDRSYSPRTEGISIKKTKQ